MIFGNKGLFAVEVGECEWHSGSSGPYVQFRYWVGDTPVGDWSDRISFVASAGYASVIIGAEFDRRRSPFPDELPDVVFRDAYDAFFSYDYTTDGGLVPYLRDRHHLDDIGMGAVHDKYGLILVVTSSGKERVIAKDLRKEVIVADISVPLGFVESVLSEYVEWGKSRWLPAQE